MPCHDVRPVHRLRHAEAHDEAVGRLPVRPPGPTGSNPAMIPPVPGRSRFHDACHFVCLVSSIACDFGQQNPEASCVRVSSGGNPGSSRLPCLPPPKAGNPAGVLLVHARAGCTAHVRRSNAARAGPRELVDWTSYRHAPFLRFTCAGRAPDATATRTARPIPALAAEPRRGNCCRRPSDCSAVHRRKSLPAGGLLGVHHPGVDRKTECDATFARNGVPAHGDGQVPWRLRRFVCIGLGGSEFAHEGLNGAMIVSAACAQGKANFRPARNACRKKTHVLTGNRPRGSASGLAPRARDAEGVRRRAGVHENRSPTPSGGNSATQDYPAHRRGAQHQPALAADRADDAPRGPTGSLLLGKLARVTDALRLAYAARYASVPSRRARTAARRATYHRAIGVNGGHAARHRRALAEAHQADRRDAQRQKYRATLTLPPSSGFPMRKRTRSWSRLRRARWLWRRPRRLSAALSGNAIEYYHAGFDHYFIVAARGDRWRRRGARSPGWSRTGRGFAVFAAPPPELLAISPVCCFTSRLGTAIRTFSASPPAAVREDPHRSQPQRHRGETPAAFFVPLFDAPPALSRRHFTAVPQRATPTIATPPTPASSRRSCNRRTTWPKATARRGRDARRSVLVDALVTTSGLSIRAELRRRRHGTVYVNAEVEPSIAVNPANPTT